MLIASDGYGHAFVGKHLYFVFRPGGDRDAVLLQLVDYDLHDFVDVLEGFLAGVPPGSGTVLLKRGAIRVPPIIVGFHDHFERVGLHRHYYATAYGLLSA